MAIDLVWLGLVLLLVPVLAEYGKMRTRVDKALSMVAGSGLMFLLAVGFEVPVWASAAPYGAYGSMLFQFIGWLMLLIGALWAVMNIMPKK